MAQEVAPNKNNSPNRSQPTWTANDTGNGVRPSRFSWVKRLMNKPSEKTPHTRPSDRTVKTNNISRDSEAVPQTELDRQSLRTNNTSTAPIVSLSTASSDSSSSAGHPTSVYTSATTAPSTAAPSNMTNHTSPGLTLFNQTHTGSNNVTFSHNPDAASVITLASSSRERRRSIETNASTHGMAPASIIERIHGPALYASRNTSRHDVNGD